MAVGRHAQPPADRLWIDAPSVEMMKVAQHRRGQCDVEAGGVQNRRRPSLQRSGQPLELVLTIVSRIETFVSGTIEQRQGVVRVLAWPTRGVDPERRGTALLVQSS